MQDCGNKECTQHVLIDPWIIPSRLWQLSNHTHQVYATSGSRGVTCSTPNMAKATGSSHMASARLPSTAVAASASSAVAQAAAAMMPPDSIACASGAAK